MTATLTVLRCTYQSYHANHAFQFLVYGLVYVLFGATFLDDFDGSKISIREKGFSFFRSFLDEFRGKTTTKKSAREVLVCPPF
jgi:hypothetical protein